MAIILSRESFIWFAAARCLYSLTEQVTTYPTSTTRWRHAMETLSALLPILWGGFPWQRPVTRSFDVVFDLRLNKRLIWTNSWINHRVAGDLRHHDSHWDVIIMKYIVVSDALETRMGVITCTQKRTCVHIGSKNNLSAAEKNFNYLRHLSV